MSSGKPVAVVTGGAGFIGSHMVDALLGAGFAVRVIDNLVGGHRSNLDHLKGNPDLACYWHDIRQLEPDSPIFADAKSVFHFAGIGDIVPSIEQPTQYMDTNVQGTVRVLECARQARVEKFVYAASSSCYGLAAVPTGEDHPIDPQYPYALSKYQGEQAAFHWHRVYGLPVNSVCIFNAYGPRVRTTGVYGAVFGVFFRQKLAGKPYTVVGDGTQRRDFIYVTDVAQAFLAAARDPDQRGALQRWGWQSAVGQPADRASRRRCGVRAQTSGRARLHLREHRQNRLATGVEAGRPVRGRRTPDAGRHRPLARRPAVGSRPHCRGDQDLVSVPRQAERLRPFMLELLDRYRHKIKSAEELRDIIGPRPRKKRVIMCHGVFDVVHPGHIRHLLYARSKADLLVASITADHHITKGTHRPHVPQDLRAVNLAAFEVVDYVVIDKNAKPIENIRIIQPDYFAKGFEYTASGMPVKTAEEADVLQSYGGEIIFTPGDIVYSSSNLIDLAPPSIKLEKLQIVMERNGITFDKLRQTLDAMTGRRVHVVGDTIVDSYTHCAMIGGQTKTPTMSVLFERKVDYVGGAAIVAKHLAAAGGRVTFSTVLGDDSYRDFVTDDLKDADIEVHAVIDRSRPTVNKNAIVVGGYRLLKVDTLDNRSISDQILEEITGAIKKVPTDAVVFADFRHGLFNRRTIPELVQALPEGCFRVADSQVASRWGNITDFQGFDLITPNEREARFALGDQDSGIRPLASNLYDSSRCRLLILKLGERGVLACCNSDHESLDSFFVIDSFVDRLIDAVGAGDALLAYSTLAMLAVRDPGIATILGSMAAAVECECDGNIPVTADDLRSKIDIIERQMAPA